MSNEELVALIQQEDQVTQNMALLYENNKGLIYKMANKFTFRMEQQDLIQEAYFGLYEAAMKFSAERGVKFSTYAVFWIRQSLLRYLENNGYCVRLPAHLQADLSQYQAFIRSFAQKTGRQPKEKDICTSLNITKAKYKKLQEIEYAYCNLQSLNQDIQDDSESTIQDFISSEDDTEKEVIDEIIEQAQQTELWKEVERRTSEQEFKVLVYRYQAENTLQTTGEQMGITRDQVRQIELLGIRKLRRQSFVRYLQEQFDLVISQAYHGSLTSFRYTWTSSTERAAMKLHESNDRNEHFIH